MGQQSPCKSAHAGCAAQLAESSVDPKVGSTEGIKVGISLGISVGALVLGAFVGAPVGKTLGDSVGAVEGSVVVTLQQSNSIPSIVGQQSPCKCAQAQCEIHVGSMGAAVGSDSSPDLRMAVGPRVGDQDGPDVAKQQSK